MDSLAAVLVRGPLKPLISLGTGVLHALTVGATRGTAADVPCAEDAPFGYVSDGSGGDAFAVEEVDRLGDACCACGGGKSHKSNDGSSAEIHGLGCCEDLDFRMGRARG